MSFPNSPRQRCRTGLAVPGWKTRCYKNLGHSGPHIAKLTAQNPYQDVRWLSVREGEFTTDKDSKYAWRAVGRPPKETE